MHASNKTCVDNHKHNHKHTSSRFAEVLSSSNRRLYILPLTRYDNNMIPSTRSTALLQPIPNGPQYRPITSQRLSGNYSNQDAGVCFMHVRQRLLTWWIRGYSAYAPHISS